MDLRRYLLSIVLLSLVVAGCVSTTDPGESRVTDPEKSGPTVALMYPDNGGPGTEIEIRGAGFGTDTNRLVVRLNGVAMKIRSVRDDRIDAIVPPASTSGAVTLELDRAIVHVGPFTISEPRSGNSPPIICCLFPQSGRVGDTITIYTEASTSTYEPVSVAMAGTRCRQQGLQGARSMEIIVPRIYPIPTHDTTVDIEIIRPNDPLGGHLRFRLLTSQVAAGTFQWVTLDIDSITARVMNRTLYGTGVEKRDTGLFTFKEQSLRSSIRSITPGPGGLDTFLFFKGESSSDGSYSITAVIDRSAGRINRLKYSHSYSSSTFIPTTKAYSSRSADESITFADLPCTRDATGRLECRLHGVDLAAYIVAANVARQNDPGGMENKVDYTTLIDLLPIGTGATLHILLE